MLKLKMKPVSAGKKGLVLWVAPANCFACGLWFNHSISPTWHLLMLIASSSSGHWNSVGQRFLYEWTPLPRKSVKTPSQYLCLLSWDLSVTNLPQSLGNWLLKSMKDQKIPVTSHITNPRSRNASVTLLQETLSLSVKVQYSNWMLLAVRCWSWKWSQFLLARQCVTFCEHGQLQGWQPHFQPNVA